MTAEVYARVVFQSPLPALDREFEYLVPIDLSPIIQIGCRVKAPFAGQIKEGFVVALDSQPEFQGKLSVLQGLVSNVPVLAPHVYQLLKAVALRQCCSVGELLDNAVPKRSVRVEKAFNLPKGNQKSFEPGERYAELVRPVFDIETQKPSFMKRIIELASMYLNEGRSTIICVPDFRDINGLAKLFADVLPKESLLVQDSTEVGSKRYQSFLSQLETAPRILLGSRSVMYSPLAEDSALIIWDDGDQSHQDQQSPYLTTRELALIRQSQFGGPIHFLSHSRSTEVQRLVEIGYLKEVSTSNWRPKVSISEGKALDGSSFKVIKKGLESGPVLFQVAAPGTARSLYCSSCNQRSSCNACNGPLWLNAQGKTVCRWCGNFNLHFLCKECGNAKLVQGAAGATRWVEQLGKSFPGIPIREVTVSQGIQEVSDKAQIVVATPGIEPVADHGYSAVVLIDCLAQLNRDTLRAPEDALRAWLNALSLMRDAGEAVAVGVSSEVSRALTLGEVTETAANLLSDREELGFPPARRLMSAVGSHALLTELGQKLSSVAGSKVLGIAVAQSAASGESFRLLVSFNYGSGNQVAIIAREFLAGLTSKAVRTNSRSGRSIRPVTIKFDDPSVL